ncbi:MAG: SUMF1/EgtB/PvdO family nonheme iron enzyme [Myxococcota bacterium]|nr:SUMF1/EgtB/PvdO family nonheme iron enzyme [Myxococcota bacterium]
MIYLLISACLVQKKETPASTEISQVIILKDGQTATSVYNDDFLRCEATVYNPDRAVEPSYLWLNGTEELSNEQDLTLSSNLALPGDEITCQVSESGDVGTAELLVENRLPSVPTSVVITPVEPIAEVDDLTCTAEGSVDPDGENVAYSYAWTSAGGIETEDQTLTADFAALDTAWTCEATPIDATGTGDSSIATVELKPNVVCNIEPCDAAVTLIQQQLDFVYIPAGMDPLGRFTLTQDYLIQNTEVTIGQFIEATGFHPTDDFDWEQVPESADHPSFVDLDYPAPTITWSMAAFFSNQLTLVHNNQNQEQLTACYDCSGSDTAVSCTLDGNPYECTGYRLPTKAEFIFAARSGSTSDIWTENGGGTIVESDPFEMNCTIGTILDGFETPLEDYAWYCDAAMQEQDGTQTYSTEVAKLLPNGFGLYDTHGNLSEWLSDARNSIDIQSNGYQPSGENPHQYSQSYLDLIMIGGNKGNRPTAMFVEYAFSHQDGQRFPYFGFRVVRTLID